MCQEVDSGSITKAVPFFGGANTGRCHNKAKRVSAAHRQQYTQKTTSTGHAKFGNQSPRQRPAGRWRKGGSFRNIEPAPAPCQLRRMAWAVETNWYLYPRPAPQTVAYIPIPIIHISKLVLAEPDRVLSFAAVGLLQVRLCMSASSTSSTQQTKHNTQID